MLENIQIQAVKTSGVVPCFILGSGGAGISPLAVEATGLAAEAPVNQLFSIANGKPCTVTVNGYVQLSNTTGYAVNSVSPVGPVVLAPSSSSFTFNGTSRAVMLPLPTANHAGMFGPGSDGSPTLDGTAAVAWASKSGSVYTMTRDVFCANLTVNSGVTLNTAGTRIFCAGAFANAGTVQNNGANASGATAGAGGTNFSLSSGGAGGGGTTGAGGAGGAPTNGGRAGCGNAGAGGPAAQAVRVPPAAAGTPSPHCPCRTPH